MSMNYSIILGSLGNTCDRFLSSGYKEQLDKDTMLKQIAQINRVKGIELVGSWDIDENNVKEMKQKLEAILESEGFDKVEALIKKRDPIATSEFIRNSLIK
jgi:PHP family Zn ribbon phosphoesterase